MPDDAIVHVIDDDDAVRDSLGFLLRSAKLQVRTYESAKSFLQVSSTLKSGCATTAQRMWS